MLNKFHASNSAFDRLLITDNTDQTPNIVAFRRYGVHGFQEQLFLTLIY
jgi:hypothetical protein